MAAKGRGLVATAPLRPGQLVLASKAVAVQFASGGGGYRAADDTPAAWDDCSLYEQLLSPQRTPVSRLREVLDLYAGPDAPPRHAAHQALELLLQDASGTVTIITRLQLLFFVAIFSSRFDNLLHLALTDKQFHPRLCTLWALGSLQAAHAEPKLRLAASVLVDYVQGVAELNQASTEALLDHTQYARFAQPDAACWANSGCGLWLLPSYINHACVANCSVWFIGDVMLVTAVAHIPAGGEVTFSYMSPLLSLQEREAQAAEVWGFDLAAGCGCALCAEQRQQRPRQHAAAEQRLQRLRQETADGGKLSPGTPPVQTRVQWLGPEIAALQQDLHGCTWQLQLYEPWVLMASACRAAGDYGAAAAAYGKAFRLLHDPAKGRSLQATPTKVGCALRAAWLSRRAAAANAAMAAAFAARCDDPDAPLFSSAGSQAAASVDPSTYWYGQARAAWAHDYGDSALLLFDDLHRGLLSSIGISNDGS